MKAPVVMKFSLRKQIVLNLIHREEGHQSRAGSLTVGCGVMVCLLAECVGRRHP